MWKLIAGLKLQYEPWYEVQLDYRFSFTLLHSLGPRPFPRLRNKYRKWGVEKKEGKGLAHRVGLARARAGMLARLERNVISCNALGSRQFL